MTAVSFSNFTGQLLVVGPIYNSLNKLLQIKEMSESYDRIIINSGLLFPNMKNLEERISLIEALPKNANITYLIGKEDLKLWYQLDPYSETAKWIINQPNVATIKWNNDYQVIIVDGGLTKKVSNLKELNNNLEISFVTDWHPYYNGNLGFVVSNNPLTTGQPKPHRFSIQLGSMPDQPTHGLVLDQYGLNRTISI